MSLKKTPRGGEKSEGRIKKKRGTLQRIPLCGLKRGAEGGVNIGISRPLISRGLPGGLKTKGVERGGKVARGHHAQGERLRSWVSQQRSSSETLIKGRGWAG